MPRPGYPWKAIYADIDSGMSQDAVCEKYGCASGTLRNKLRKRDKATTAPEKPRTSKRAPKPRPTAGGNAIPFPARQRTRTPAPRDEERSQRMAREARAERERAKAARIADGARAAGLDRHTLQENIRLTNDKLHDAIQRGDSRAATDFTKVLTMLTEKLGAILTADEQFKPADQDPDLDTEEGQIMLATMLDQNPHLIARCKPDVLRAALRRAEAREEAG